VKNVNLLSEGSYSKGSELTDGYPEFTFGVLKKLGWDKDLTEAELATINKIGGNSPDGVGWAVDLSGGIIRVALDHGCIPFGNGKARAVAWNLPIRCRCIASRSTPRVPNSSPNTRRVGRPPVPHGQSRLRDSEGRGGQGLAKQFPIILTSGRLSNMKAAARKPAPIAGLPSCSRTCSSRSTPRMRASAASRTAAGSGLRPGELIEGARQGTGHRPCRQGRGVHASTSPAGSRASTSAAISKGQRSDRARRKREHDH